jgi:hypothetical protein
MDWSVVNNSILIIIPSYLNCTPSPPQVKITAKKMMLAVDKAKLIPKNIGLCVMFIMTDKKGQWR